MLSKKIICTEVENYFSDKYLYFDIETTGFSASYNQVRMITYMYYKGNQRYIETHFAELKEDENLLLAEFIAISKKHIALIHFNGSTFDIPFLNKRMQKYDLSFEIDKSNTLDLYKLIKRKYNLDSYKLKDLESHFGVERKDEIDGSIWLKMLKEYDEGNTRVINDLVLHNYEDVLNLEMLIDNSKLRETIESRIINSYFIKDVVLSSKHARVILKNQKEEIKIDVPTIKHKNITLLLDEKFDSEPKINKKKYIIAVDNEIIYSNIYFIIRVGGGTQI